MQNSHAAAITVTDSLVISGEPHILYDPGKDETGPGIDIRFTFLGKSVHQKTAFFNHPYPAITRLFLFKSGKAKLKTAAGEYQLSPNRVYLLPTGQSFLVTYYQSVFYFAHLDIKGIGIRKARQDSLASIGYSLTEGINAFPSVKISELQAEWMRLYERKERTALYPVLFQLAYRLLESSLVDESTDDKTADYNDNLVTRAIKLIQDETIEDLSIKKLAVKLGCAREHLSRRFKLQTGSSLQDYLLEKRINQSLRLLSISDLKVVDIASRLGWEDPSCFYKVFKRRLGITPAQYRRCHMV